MVVVRLAQWVGRISSGLAHFGCFILMGFMPLEIETERTILRGLILDDAEVLYAYRSDPAVYAYHAWNPEDLDAARRFIEQHSMNSSARIGEWKQLGIYLKADGALIGDCGFYRPGAEEAEIGYTVVPAHQAKGMATEVVSALVKFLFSETSTNRVIAKTDPENIASIRVLEKIGFEKVSHLVKSVQIRGEWKDDLVFCLRTN